MDRRRGVFERARSESSLGNWIGIAHPVLAELAYRVECSPNRDRLFFGYPQLLVINSIASRSDGRRRATDALEEQLEFCCDVLVAAVDQKLHILNDFQHDFASCQRLRLSSGAVAVVDAIVPSLEQVCEAVF